MWRRGPARGDAPAAPSVPAGVVTALTPASRRPGRWDLTVDGAATGSVSIDLVEQFGLRVGRVLGADEAARVSDAVDALGVYDRALGMLAARGRSSKDLRRRLVQGGSTPLHADAAVSRLQDGGLLDDGAYARQVARSRVASRGDSRRRVAQSLTQAGVARGMADEAVAEVFEQEAVDEVALAEGAARKRLRMLSGLDPVVRRRRLYGYLARRGHDGILIRDVLARVLGDRVESEADDMDDASEDVPADDGSHA